MNITKNIECSFSELLTNNIFLCKYYLSLNCNLQIFYSILILNNIIKYIKRKIKLNHFA